MSKVFRILLVWSVFMGMCVSSGPAQSKEVEYIDDCLGRLLYVGHDSWSIWQLGINTSAYSPHLQKRALPLKIRDKDYSRGLGCFLYGEVRLRLDGECSLFEAEIGIQSGTSGTAQFEVYVDGQKRYASAVMSEKEEAVPVSVPVEEGRELQLVVKGTEAFYANWADARLELTDRSVRARTGMDGVDIAPFARVVTWDPNREDGCRVGRLEEYKADEVYLETELKRDAGGLYTIPKHGTGRSCIGLQWLGRRSLTGLAIQFSDARSVPQASQVQVQGWVGESVWQGKWAPLKGRMELRGDRLIFHTSPTENPEGFVGSSKIRWMLPASENPSKVRRLSAYTASRWDKVDLSITAEKSAAGKLEIYNGAMKVGGETKGIVSHDFLEPLHLEVCYSKPWLSKTDRTVIYFRMPTGDFAVAVDDVLANDCVYVKEYGVFIALESAETTLAQYKKKIAGRKTIIESVRAMPDQTFEQAVKKVHRKIQNNGPTLVSLACTGESGKFIVQRDGGVSFKPYFEDVGKETNLNKYNHELVPRFGSGRNDKLARYMDGGWMPVPVTKVEEGSIAYTTRVCAAPWSECYNTKLPATMYERSVCAVEYTVENTGASPAAASMKLDFVNKETPFEFIQARQTPFTAVVSENGSLLASVDTMGTEPLKASLADGSLVLSGEMPGHAKARFYAYIPSWKMDPSEYAVLTGGEALFERTKEYWNRVMSDAMQIDIPDLLLADVIRASQVHCLTAARGDEAGSTIAPWIAGKCYGPLESETQPIILGMGLMGHTDFSRLGLEWCLSRYNPAGYLTTGYTIFGTGWNLWVLGEYYKSSGDRDWMKRYADTAAWACHWITRQLEKTKKLDVNWQKMPEYGLTPPAVVGDWNSFGYRFTVNGYYYAGMQAISQALRDIGHPEADSISASAKDFGKDIRRSYKWAQARTPVVPLRDGTWVPGAPSMVHCLGPVTGLFPGADGGRGQAGDIEVGPHQLACQGVLDVMSPEITWKMNYLEDAEFLAEGFQDYPASASREDWFNLGGFAKCQPYYTRITELYALRDDVKPFIRTYFNTIPSLLNLENLSFWEHFYNNGAWNKTHETGNFLQHTRLVFLMERGNKLWLAPFVTSNWMKDGMSVSIKNAPTHFGPVSYQITSHVKAGYMEATITPPVRTSPDEIVIRLRHPEQKPINSVKVQGGQLIGFDPAREIVRIRQSHGKATIRAEY